MKKLTLMAATAAALAHTPALAGSPEAPVFPVTQIAPPATTDWSGFYAGGMVSFDDAGFINFFNGGVPGSAFPEDSATTFGGFAGYNFQNGAFVYGGELSVSSGGFGASGFPAAYFETIFDLKGRAGYSFGDVLVYGVVGGS